MEADNSATIQVRPAQAGDLPLLIEFNRLMALETENLRLDEAVLSAGVRDGLEDPAKARYFVAECADQVVGQLMLTQEHSDWRNGTIWWIQSVFVHADYRRRGVYRALHKHIGRLARQTPGVVGLRLYVATENTRAQTTYSRLGMKDAHYKVMEEIWSSFPP